MGTTRQEGLRYLEGKLRRRPRCVAVSRLFTAKESWTHKETWWFDLPIKKIEELPDEVYYLLGEWKENKFVMLEVPNRFLWKNRGRFNIRYQQRIRLHLAAYEENWLVDERSHNRVDFSEFEV